MGPIGGFIFDRYGKRMYGIVLIPVCMLLCIVLSVVFPVEPSGLLFIPFTFYAFAWFFYGGCFWAVANSCIPKNLISTGTGFLYCTYSLYILVIAFLYGLIRDETKKYMAGFFWAQCFLIGFLLIGLSLFLIMVYKNSKEEKGFNAVELKRSGNDDLSQLD